MFLLTRLEILNILLHHCWSVDYYALQIHQILPVESLSVITQPYERYRYAVLVYSVFSRAWYLKSGCSYSAWDLCLCGVGTVWQVCQGTTRRRTSAAQRPTTACWKIWSSGLSTRSKWLPSLELAWAATAVLSLNTLCREVSKHTLTFMMARCVQCTVIPIEFKWYLSILFILAPPALVALVFNLSLNCVFAFSGNTCGVKHTHWDLFKQWIVAIPSKQKNH